MMKKGRGCLPRFATTMRLAVAHESKASGGGLGWIRMMLLLLLLLCEAEEDSLSSN